MTKKYNTQMKPQHYVFIDEYIANGFNMTQAYAKAYPDCSIETARRNGSRLMKTARIKDAIAQKINEFVGTPDELHRKILLKLADMAFASKDDEYYTPPISTKAIDMLNKLGGKYTEKIEVTQRHIVVGLEDDDDEHPDDND